MQRLPTPIIITLTSFVLLAALSIGSRAEAGTDSADQDLPAQDALAQAAPAQAAPAQERAWFRMGFSHSDSTFVIELQDADLIADARSQLALPVEERQGVMGHIVKQPAAYNPGWSYHLDPTSIELFDQAIEVCDGNPDYIEAHLDEVCGALLPGCTWCPWSSHIAAELDTPPGMRVHLPVLLRDARLGLPAVRVIDGPIEPDAWPSAPYTWVDARINGDRLQATLSHSGGCEIHAYELVASRLFMESWPVQADLLLAHDDRDDPCDGLITAELEFDLTPLREAYYDAYQGSEGPLLLRLRGRDDSLRYDFGPRP